MLVFGLVILRPGGITHCCQRNSLDEPFRVLLKSQETRFVARIRMHLQEDFTRRHGAMVMALL